MSIKKWLVIICAVSMLSVSTTGLVFARTDDMQFKETPAAALTDEVSVQSSATAEIPIAKPDYSFLNGKTGIEISIRLNEETLKNLINKYRGVKVEKMLFADSTATCLSMMKADKVDFILTSIVTADYLVQRNPEFKIVECEDKRGFSMVLRGADNKLRDSINSAVDKLKENGKLDELYTKWIENLPVGEEPSMNKLDKLEGAETIYVGVSGDAPPLDYVAADGRPAGYNIALLGEISKIIGKNIEIVSLDSNAKYTALEAKKIDVFFWEVMPNEKTMQDNLNATEDEQNFYKKFVVTNPYCIVKTAFIIDK